MTNERKTIAEPPASANASGGRAARFSDSRGADYARSQEGLPRDEQVHRFFAGFQARFFQPHIRTSHRVLDFGCGPGRILAALAASEKVGVDANVAVHPLCRARGIRVISTVENLAPDERFDVIISNHALEHIPRPLEALTALRRFLKADGKFILMTPIDDWRARRQRVCDPHDWDRHLYTWTPRLLGNLLMEAGFAVETIRIIRSAWHPRLYPLRHLGRGALAGACALLALILRRRELLAICRNGDPSMMAQATGVRMTVPGR